MAISFNIRCSMLDVRCSSVDFAFRMASGTTERTSSKLSRLIDDLDGVGPTRAKHLRALGIKNLGDLLEYFPRTYQFESGERAIGELTSSDAIQQARGQVVAVDYIP